MSEPRVTKLPAWAESSGSVERATRQALQMRVLGHLGAPLDVLLREKRELKRLLGGMSLAEREAVRDAYHRSEESVLQPGIVVRVEMRPKKG